MNSELPDPQAVKTILTEINMNEIELEEIVVHLREWLKKQPHLPKSADDVTLKSFIIGCKSLERAKSKLDSYYRLRVLYPYPSFEDRDPCKLNWIRGQKMFILPGFTPNNCKVVMFTNPLKESLPDFDLGTSLKIYLMYYDMIIRRYYMSSGIYVIFDMCNFTKEMLIKLSPSLIKQHIKIFQESYPIRLKRFVGFNVPVLAEMFLNTFVKPFLNRKLKERMFLNSSDHTCLENYIPLEMFPSDYGGNSKSSDALNEADKAFCDGMQEWFLKEGSEKSMEDFRPKPEKGASKKKKKTQVD